MPLPFTGDWHFRPDPIRAIPNLDPGHQQLSFEFHHKCLSAEMLNRLEAIFADLLAKWGGELIEFGGEPDHVHLLSFYYA